MRTPGRADRDRSSRHRPARRRRGRQLGDDGGGGDQQPAVPELTPLPGLVRRSARGTTQRRAPTRRTDDHGRVRRHAAPRRLRRTGGGGNAAATPPRRRTPSRTTRRPRAAARPSASSSSARRTRAPARASPAASRGGARRARRARSAPSRAGARSGRCSRYCLHGARLELCVGALVVRAEALRPAARRRGAAALRAARQPGVAGGVEVDRERRQPGDRGQADVVALLHAQRLREPVAHAALAAEVAAQRLVSLWRTSRKRPRLAAPQHRDPGRGSPPKRPLNELICVLRSFGSFSHQATSWPVGGGLERMVDARRPSSGCRSRGRPPRSCRRRGSPDPGSSASCRARSTGWRDAGVSCAAASAVAAHASTAHASSARRRMVECIMRPNT